MECKRFLSFCGTVCLFVCACASAQIKNIVFDVDNVIVRSDKGSPKDTSEQGKLIWTKLKNSNLREKWTKGFISADDIRLALEKDFPQDKDVVEKLLTYKIMRPRHVIAETGNIIERLKVAGYRLYIISNTTRERYLSGIDKIPLFRLFDGMTLSYNAQSNKPEKEIFKAFFKQYNIKPDKCVFIDDKEGNVGVAKELGMDGIIYRPNTLEIELQKLGVML